MICDATKHTAAVEHGSASLQPQRPSLPQGAFDMLQESPSASKGPDGQKQIRQNKSSGVCKLFHCKLIKCEFVRRDKFVSGRFCLLTINPAARCRHHATIQRWDKSVAGGPCNVVTMSCRRPMLCRLRRLEGGMAGTWSRYKRRQPQPGYFFAS